MTAKRQCTNCKVRRVEAQYETPGARVCSPCKREARRRTARARHVKRTYEITIDELDAILAAQNGTCAICKGRRRYNLSVDHDHEFAERFGVRASVRGALCRRCNKLLRDAGDDVAIFQAAIDYLLNPPAKRILFP